MNKKDLDSVNLLKSDIAILYNKVTRETNSLTTDAYNTFSKVSTDMTAVTNKVAVLGDMLTDLRVLNGTAKTIQYLSDLDVVQNNGIKISDDKFELATLNTINREINSTQSSISSLENYSLKTINGKPAYLEDFIKTGSELVVDFPTSNYTFTLNLRYDSPEQINSIDLQLALTTESYPLLLSIKYVDTNNNISEAIILDNNSKNINLDEYRVRDNLYTLNITPIVTDQLLIEFSSRDKSSVALKGIKTTYRTPINEGNIILGPIHSEHPILKLALNSDKVTEGVLFEVSSDLDYWLPITNSSSIATTGGKKILSFNTVNTNSIKTDEDVYSLYIKVSLTSKEITNEDVPIEIYKTYREDNAISNDTLGLVEDNLFSAYRVQNSDFSYGNYLYVNTLNTSKINLEKLEYIENDGVLKVLGLVSSKYSVTSATNEGISIGSIGAELKLHRLEANKVIDARGFDLANSIIYDVYPRRLEGVVNTKQKDNFCLMLKSSKPKIVITEEEVQPNPPNPPISCTGATQEAILSGINIINGWTNPVTVDIYVNNILVATDITASYINQYWTSIDALKNNAETLGYYVSGDSSRQETFYNPSASNITFSFVPKSDGIYNGTTYFAKDALTISANNSNPTAYKDPATGTLSFCLAATDNSPTFESSEFMTTVDNTYSPHNSAYVMCKISDSNGVTLAQVNVHSLEDTDYSFNGAISVAIDKLKENTEIASYIDISYIQNAVTETHIDILVQNKTSIDLMVAIEFQAESSIAYVINANLRGNV